MDIRIRIRGLSCLRSEKKGDFHALYKLPKGKLKDKRRRSGHKSV